MNSTPTGVARHGISVVRRISGGGAMFMEAGNCITYSLYLPQTLVDGISFADSYSFLDAWVMAALEKVGISAFYVPLNDIATEHGKIGGAAQKRLANGGMLHHVTMSYDIDADKMVEVLRIGQEKLSDKGTRSAKKRVDPLRRQTGMARAEIVAAMMDVFAERYGATPSELTDAELEAASRRVRDQVRHRGVAAPGSLTAAFPNSLSSPSDCSVTAAVFSSRQQVPLCSRQRALGQHGRPAPSAPAP